MMDRKRFEVIQIRDGSWGFKGVQSIQTGSGNFFRGELQA